MSWRFSIVVPWMRSLNSRGSISSTTAQDVDSSSGEYTRSSRLNQNTKHYSPRQFQGAPTYEHNEEDTDELKAHQFLQHPIGNNNDNKNDDDDDDDYDDNYHDHDLESHANQDEKPVTWRSLPKKGQLAIITIARLSEPLTQTSLQAYMFYQLRSFNPSLPDAVISSQTGILQGAFTAAQFATAIIWGRIADTEYVGRKRVLLIGLLGTSISCVGFGFSRSFLAAAVFRTLGGALNSNVGVMRTMIAEIIQEKKYAFHFPFLFAFSLLSCQNGCSS